MSEISEERKNEIRQSEDYKTAKKILDPLYHNIVGLKKKIDLALGFEFTERLEFHPHYADFKQNCQDLKEKWDEAKKVSKILRDLKTYSFDPSHEYAPMMKMLAYLGLVESLGVALADMVLILLIANGKEVHTRGPMTRHVTRATELEKIDLAYKLDFLEDEGLELFAEFINRDVRNHIAHLKFMIRDNGEIRKRDGSPIDIDANISRFWDGVETLMLIFEDIGFLKWFEKEGISHE
jgi:hypothetical protein